MPPSELLLPAPQSPRVPAHIRELVEDFEVLELLEPSAPFSGTHRWIQIRKTGISTPAAARRIADHLGCDVRDIGYAGLKDERSVSEQWFSVPAAEDVQLSFPEAADLILLQQVAQARKLRRGNHQGNRFRLRLKAVGDRVEVPSEWTFPNYFGARRFGVDNVERAEDWLKHRRKRRISPFKQGIYLSVLRSLLFNDVLATRVRAGNWASVLSGDVVDDQGLPTAPLWGRGRSATQGDAAELESNGLQHHREICEGLEFAGLDQARRGMVGVARDVVSEWLSPGELRLEFTLATGCYATVALSMFFVLSDAADR